MYNYKTGQYVDVEKLQPQREQHQAVHPSLEKVNFNSNAAPAGPGLAGVVAPTTAPRKRARDIRNIDRFRETVFGPNGLGRLYAMACRNPVLMYPPDGIPEARARYLATAQQVMSQAGVSVGKEEEDVMDLIALADERYRAEKDDLEYQEQQQLSPSSDVHYRQRPGNDRDDAANVPAESNDANNLDVRVATCAMDSVTDASMPDATVRSSSTYPKPTHPHNDAYLANYHHRQLDVLVKMFYEFNHMTFLKLPMSDTIQMLARCSRDAAAHVTEHEMHLRLAHSARVRELQRVHDEGAMLRRRQRALDEAVARHELAMAEKMQRELDAEEAQREHEELHILLRSDDAEHIGAASESGMTTLCDAVAKTAVASHANSATDERSNASVSAVCQSLPDDGTFRLHEMDKNIAVGKYGEEEWHVHTETNQQRAGNDHKLLAESDDDNSVVTD